MEYVHAFVCKTRDVRRAWFRVARAPLSGSGERNR
jgi:hypothetical protein